MLNAQKFPLPTYTCDFQVLLIHAFKWKVEYTRYLHFLSKLREHISLVQTSRNRSYVKIQTQEESIAEAKLEY